MISWRDVLDCKIVGTNVSDMIESARKLGYRYVCVNDQIFQTSPFKGWSSKTPLSAKDIR